MSFRLPTDYEQYRSLRKTPREVVAANKPGSRRSREESAGTDAHHWVANTTTEQLRHHTLVNAWMKLSARDDRGGLLSLMALTDTLHRADRGDQGGLLCRLSQPNSS